MIPRPPLLGGKDLIAWRLDLAIHASSWDSGEGAFLKGARWNSPGQRVVYCALDAATAILEIAAHKQFGALDAVPHVLTSVVIHRPKDVKVIEPQDVPNANWLRPGSLSKGQQDFGTDLLAKHRFVCVPSVVSTNSWNLIFVKSAADGAYALRSQEDFALDTRLHPAK